MWRRILSLSMIAITASMISGCVRKDQLDPSASPGSTAVIKGYHGFFTGGLVITAVDGHAFSPMTLTEVEVPSGRHAVEFLYSDPNVGLFPFRRLAP